MLEGQISLDPYSATVGETTWGRLTAARDQEDSETERNCKQLLMLFDQKLT